MDRIDRQHFPVVMDLQQPRVRVGRTRRRGTRQRVLGESHRRARPSSAAHEREHVLLPRPRRAPPVRHTVRSIQRKLDLSRRRPDGVSQGGGGEFGEND